MDEYENNETSECTLNYTLVLSDSEEECLNLEESHSEKFVNNHFNLNANGKSDKKRTRKQEAEGKPDKKMKVNHECSVCLSIIRAKKMANPSGCKHYFCIPCSKKWSKNRKTCPLDRIEYSHINVIDRESLTVIMKVDDKWKEIKSYDCMNQLCFVCQMDESANTLITCDRCMQKFHIGCLPSPDKVRAGSWLCQTCELLGVKKMDNGQKGHIVLQRCIAISRYRDSLLRNQLHRCVDHSHQRDAVLRARLIQDERPQLNVAHQPTSTARISSESSSVMESVSSGYDALGRILQEQSSCFAETFNKPKTSSHVTEQSQKSNNSLTNNRKITMLEIERLAKQFLMPHYTRKSITKEKFKKVLKSVVPKVYKETKSAKPDSLHQLVKERVMVWMEIL